MLYCEMVELYPITDSVRCEDCPEFSFCPVVNDDWENDYVSDIDER